MDDEASIFDMDIVLDMVYMVGKEDTSPYSLPPQDGMVKKIENLKKVSS